MRMENLYPKYETIKDTVQIFKGLTQANFMYFFKYPTPLYIATTYNFASY